MSRPVFTEDAADDYAAAFRWYESQRAGRSRSFTQAIESSLDHIEHSPESFPVVFSHFPRIVVRRFPYVMFFRLESGKAVVHAVFHTSLNPSALRGRLRDA